MTFLITRMIKNVKIKKESNIEMDETETIPYALPKGENEIDDSETIAYASPKRESEDEIDEKVETVVEIGKQAVEDKKKIFQK